MRASREWVCAVAGVTLLGKALECIWLVMPGFADLSIALPVALLALAGLCALSAALTVATGDAGAIRLERLRHER